MMTLGVQPPHLHALPLEEGDPVAMLTRRQHAEGRERYGDLAYALAAYQARVVRKTSARLDNPEADLVAALAALVGEDLYLGSACDAGREAGWTTLDRTFRARLEALLRSRGVGVGQARELIGDVFSDLSLPALDTEDERRIGRYSGRGALFSFLATIVLRKRADAADQAARRRTREMRRASLAPEAGHAVEPAAGRAVSHELVQAARRALADALAACTPRQHLVLVLRYRDGMRQQAIADTLGVGAPRISRLLGAATEKLMEELRPRLMPYLDVEDEQAWVQLCDVVRSELDRSMTDEEVA